QSPFELAYVQWLAAKLQLFLRNFELAKTAAAASSALSDEHGFRLLADGARFYIGLAEVAGGQPNYAMAPSVPLSVEAETITLSWIAAAQALAGNTADALKTVERALQVRTDYARPEAMRIRGELRLSQKQTEAAEADFRDSLALARKQGAKAWELRSA